jgi:murein DD-endopeptidase MepM/ murein hydrolase activator NlpD
MLRALVLILPILVWHVDAAPPATRARRTPPRQELKVAPSGEIEARVEAENRKADTILANLDPATLFDSPYLFSALYYRDAFLSTYAEDRADADPARRIIAHIKRQLTPEKKAAIIRLLQQQIEERAAGADAAAGGDAGDSAPAEAPVVAPVALGGPNRYRKTRRIHPNAVDLFAREGSPVRSASRGVVLVAENGWTESDPFSTTSHAGGNTVIIFDPATNRFFRYGHLQSVQAIPGARVDAGFPIGQVGHSGLNASRNGHGRHVHFEINRFENGSVRPLSYKEVWDLLR